MIEPTEEQIEAAAQAYWSAFSAPRRTWAEVKEKYPDVVAIVRKVVTSIVAAALNA
jgi:hypothetical protein